MSHDGTRVIPIGSDVDIILVRREARAVAEGLGFGVTDLTRVVTVASELARNVFLYAGTGTATVRPVTAGLKSGIELVFADEGPGIADVERAMQPGYSTSRGLGLGLTGARRLMDEMEIVTAPGQGTTVTVRRWVRP